MLKKPSVPNADFSLSMICRANHAAPRPGGPRAAPDRRRASPGGALTAVPAFASAHRAPAPEHRRRREFAALRASRLRAGEEGGGAGTAAPRPTRAPEGRGQQGDARAAAGRQGAAAGSRYARARPRRRRRELLREIFSPRLLLPSILLFAETTIVMIVPWQIGLLCERGTCSRRGGGPCSACGPSQARSCTSVLPCRD